MGDRIAPGLLAAGAVWYCLSGDPSEETCAFNLRFGVVRLRTVKGLATGEDTLLRVTDCALVTVPTDCRLDPSERVLLPSVNESCNSKDVTLVLGVLPLVVCREPRTFARRSKVSLNGLSPAIDEPLVLGLVIFCVRALVPCGIIGLRRLARMDVSADTTLETDCLEGMRLS